VLRPRQKEDLGSLIKIENLSYSSKTTPKMYRIAWKSKVSDLSGNGSYSLNEDEAKEQVASLTKDFPLATYWYEGDLPTPLNLKGHFCSYGDSTLTGEASPSPKPERPPPLNLRFHNIIAYLSPACSPLGNPKSPSTKTNEDVPKVAKLKKTCSFGDVTIHEFPNLSPYSASPMASPVA
jgi:hypothetical protein